MEDQDKAKTTIPETPNQELLSRVDRRDKLVRGVELAILFIIVLFNIFLGLRIQSVIDQNQADVLRAREANIQRQVELKDYIKCVLIIRFDYTPEELATKEGVTKALDTCAKTSVPPNIP